MTLDDVTKALIASEYFVPAQEYGIGRASFGGGFATGSTCRGPHGTVGWSDVVELLDCAAASVVPSRTPRDIYAIFIPPGSTAEMDFMHCPRPTPMPSSTASSSPLPGFGAYHSSTPTHIFIVIPTNPGCNPGLGGVLSSLSHEMIEAATDPRPLTGWSRWGGLAVADPYSGEIGEVADDCNTPPTALGPGGTHAPPSPSPLPFMAGLVQSYWSNAANACVPAWPHTSPTITGVTVTGVGSAMRMTVRGRGFGALPDGFALGVGKLPYFEVDATPAGGATSTFGSSVTGSGPNAANLRYSSWSDTRIDIASSGDLPGISIGDTLDVIVSNPLDGATAATALLAPMPARVRVTAALTELDAGEATTIRLVVLDGSSQPVAGAPIHVRIDDPFQTHVETSTGVDASVATTVPFLHSGRVPVRGSVSEPLATPSAIAYVNVHPVVSAVEPNHGRSTGGTSVTLLGAGLIGLSGVQFGTANWAALQGPGDGSTIRVTSPAGSGPVPVVAIAALGGPIPSAPDGPSFVYYDPGVPVLTALQGNILDCTAVTIDAQAWNDDGGPLATRHIDFFTDAGRFVSSGTTTGDTQVGATLDRNGVARVVLRAPNGSTANVRAKIGTAAARTTVSIPGQCARPMRIEPSRVADVLAGRMQLPVCEACTPVDVPRGSAVARSATLLTTLGVLPQSRDSRLGPASLVTRAQFNDALAKLVGRPVPGPVDFRVRGKAAGNVTATEALRAIATAARLGDTDMNAVAAAAAISSRAASISRGQLALLLEATLRRSLRAS